MNDTLKTALWFYTGADYLIINSFLWRDKCALNECLEIVWNNNRVVIQEAEEQTPEMRFSSSGIDAIQLYENYRTRTPEFLTDAAKNQMIDQVIEDIRCICFAMQCTHEEMRLIRNVDERYAIVNLKIGDLIELLGLTSTSTTGQLIDYGQDNYRKPGQIFHIHVGANLPAILMENSRENEVILPPMAYCVLDRYDENGIDIVVLEALYPLDLESLIFKARAVWME